MLAQIDLFESVTGTSRAGRPPSSRVRGTLVAAGGPLRPSGPPTPDQSRGVQ